MLPAARDLICVAALAVAAALGIPALLRGVVPAEQAHLVLTFAAASAGVAAAILADMAWRLSQDRRFAWLSAALALYSVGVVPSATIDVITEQGGAALQAGRLMALLTVVLLLGFAVWPPARLSALGGWVLAGVGLLLTLATIGVLLIVPDAHAVVEAVSAAPLVLVAGLVLAAVALALTGLREHHTAYWRVALGLLVLGGAHLYRIRHAGPAEPAQTFAVLQLAGLLVVLFALVGLVRAALQAVHDEQDELLVANTDAFRASEQANEQAAERDHELRNGLAGLSGSIQLLGLARSDDDHRRLQAAVDAELNRLSTILDPSRPRQEPGSYAVGEVLDHLVTLWQASGSRIELTTDPSLRAAGSASVLAQVVTNLLANCDRHAHGAAVMIRAFRRGDRAVVEVADDGPGIPPDVAEAVLRRGMRLGSGAGEGLGLHISRQLAEGVGGAVRVLAAEHGCMVQVELPVTAAPGGHQRGVSAVLAR